MRTKALLLSAAVGAMSVASTLAQVYSVNVVGFVNVNMTRAGWYLLSNPLKASADTLSAIIPAAPEETVVYTWNKQLQTWNNNASFIGGEWDVPNMPIAPGDAFFLSVKAATTLTFVGEVRQGTLNTPLAVGWSFVGSQVAQSGLLGDALPATADLGYVPAEEDVVYQYNGATQQYTGSRSFIGGEWDVPPVLGMAEGIALNRKAAGSWSRTFQVQ